MFLYSHWLRLPLPTRNKIAQSFNIPKKGPTHVDSNVITSDGYDVKDIEAGLTVDKLQEHFGTNETDLEVLWGFLVDQAEGRVVPDLIAVDVPSLPSDLILEPGEVIDIPRDTVIVSKPKRGRPKKVK